MTNAASSELSVRSESVQMLYGQYLSNRFRVNRRYQRKLVWSVEEKQRLIDSILQGLPIPLFLMAEIGPPPDAPYELIDGMQRLNAIFSFLENEFSVDEKYFDLDSLADTKDQKDAGTLMQKLPVLGRFDSVKIANYAVALSIYRAVDSANVDEVFRRINSGGRRLLRQELRQAGTTSSLADLVRIISSRVRTDTSPNDVVPLDLMPKISITSKDLDYGVPADDIFWVREGILRREEVRSSVDEQSVLDILIDCLVDPMPNSGTRIRDDYYNFSFLQGDEQTPESIAIETNIAAYGQERFEADFMHVYDEIRYVLAEKDIRFSSLIEAGSGGRSPRYFHVIFMAFYELMYQERMTVNDRSQLAEKLRGIGKGAGSVPGGGGDWGRASKRKAIDAVKGVIRSCFDKSAGPEDYSQYGWSSQLETLLGNAVIEQQMFDCKQGVLQLNADRPFDQNSFEKICRTLVAMANRGTGAVGHIAIGIADNQDHAARVLALDGVESVQYKGFYIVGVGREAAILGKSANDYYAWLLQQVRGSSLLPQDIAQHVASDARLANYRDRLVIILRVMGRDQPYFFKKALVDRSGSETVDVDQSEYMRIYSRFQARQG
jgi:hypothetical protein